MVEAEPDAPAMMIKGYGEQERTGEENCQHALEIKAEDDQAKKVNPQNHHLCCDHVDENRPDKKARLAHEDRSAGRALRLNLKRALND